MIKALLVLLAVIAVVNAAASNYKPKTLASLYLPSLRVGIAHLRGTTLDSGIDGTAYFVQLNATHHWVWINVMGITQNPNALHGVHVHVYGDITEPAALSAGGHYAGAGSTTHACEDTTVRHEGDMGNWQATGGMLMTLTKTLDLLDTTGSNSIIGKAIVLHNGTDDCVTQPTGNSGGRLAVGVIGIANPIYLPSAVLSALGASDNVFTNLAKNGDATILKAVAVLTPTTSSTALTNVRGTVTFEQDASGAVTVTGVFQGLTVGKGYGLHIHSFADYYTGTVVNGTSAGPHFGLQIHGSPTSPTRDTGDLGNICSYDGAGNAYYRFVMSDGRFTLNGANNILGHNIIIHDSYDTMQANSSFGLRVSLGVIGVLNNTATGLVTIPSTVTVSDPMCLSVAPTTTTTGSTTTTTGSAATTTTGAAATTTTTTTTNAGTTNTITGTTTSSSSASFVAVCSAMLLVMLAVVVF